jgi:hypothetical protein
MAEICYWRDL